MASFTKDVDLCLAKLPLNFNGGCFKLELTSLFNRLIIKLNFELARIKEKKIIQISQLTDRPGIYKYLFVTLFFY